MDSVYDCKSEVIGPGFFRFKAEIGDSLSHIEKLPYTFWHYESVESAYG